MSYILQILLLSGLIEDIWIFVNAFHSICKFQKTEIKQQSDYYVKHWKLTKSENKKALTCGNFKTLYKTTVRSKKNIHQNSKTFGKKQ